MPTEFFHGRPLSPDDLEMLRSQIEHGFYRIEVIDPEIRGMVNGPHLLANLPLEEDD
jgi:hypothetical protein